MNPIVKSALLNRARVNHRCYSVALLAASAALSGCSGNSGTNASGLLTAAAPTFSPAGGSYSSSQTVTITDASPRTTIHYTTDGSMPTSASAVYIAPITVASSETINAFAAEIGYTSSAIATASYTLSNLSVLAQPTIWDSGGANSSQHTVTITEANAAATIYYTTDGSTPSANSPVYSVPIILSASGTIRAIAEETGYNASSVASLAVTISATPWDNITVSGQAAYTEEIPLGYAGLSAAGAVNVVTQGGVDNTGATDAACAIQDLLNNSTLTHNNVQYGSAAPYQDVIFFFPNGTYLLSNPACLPLVKNYSDGTPAYGMVFLGESQSGVVLKLASNTSPSVSFTGNTTIYSSTISNLSSTAGLYVNQHIEGPTLRAGTTITSVGTSSITLSTNAGSTAISTSMRTLTPIIFTQSAEASRVQNGNEGFNNVLENFTIDTSASGNSGAIGISYLASNRGAIRNVTLIGGSTSEALGTGIDMTRSEIGPALVENVAITGFNWGMDVANVLTSITVEHITFANQVSGAIRNADNLVAANALWIKSGQGTAAIQNSTQDGMIVLANSRIDQTGPSLVENTSNGAISIYNTTFASAQTNLGSSSGAVNGVLAAQTWTAGSNFLLPLTIDTPVLAYDPASQWTAPASGMSAQWTDEVTTPVDATSAINAALACSGNRSTLYLPHGIWYISSPIQIPSWVDRVIGMDSTIRVLPSASSNFPAGTPMFEVLSNSSGACPFANTIVIERLLLDGSIIVGTNAIQVNAPASGIPARNVVLRDVSAASVGFQVYRVSGGGELFVEDITYDPVRVDGTNYFFARQLNPEAGIYCDLTSCAPRITNNGAPAWILGLKTEGPSNILNSLGTTPPYAVSEIIGAFTNTAPANSTFTAAGTTCVTAGNLSSTPTATSAAYIVSTGPEVEASFIEEDLPNSNETAASQSYPFYVYDAGSCTAGAGNPVNPYTTGVIKRIGTSSFPQESGFIVPKLLIKP